MYYFWLNIPKKTKNPNPSPIGNRFGFFLFGGRGWIRTTEALSSRFTVCPHWPLGNTPSSFVPSSVPGDLFILPQAARFVNRFFHFSCRLLGACLPRAGLLAYSITPGGICQRAICVLGIGLCSSTKILIPLVFFQTVLYNSDNSKGMGRRVPFRALLGGGAFGRFCPAVFWSQM